MSDRDLYLPLVGNKAGSPGGAEPLVGGRKEWFRRGIGICVPWQHAVDARKLADRLHAPAYCTYQYKSFHGDYDAFADVRWTPSLWALRRDGFMLEAIEVARKHPGRSWFVGNEQSVRGQVEEPAERAAAAAWAWVEGTRMDGVGIAPWAGPNEPLVASGEKWVLDWKAAGAPMPDCLSMHAYGIQSEHDFRSRIGDGLKLRDKLGIDGGFILHETNCWECGSETFKGYLRAAQRLLREESDLIAVYVFCTNNAAMPPSYQWPWSWLVEEGEEMALTAIGRYYRQTMQTMARKMEPHPP